MTAIIQRTRVFDKIHSLFTVPGTDYITSVTFEMARQDPFFMNRIGGRLHLVSELSDGLTISVCH